jgi:transcriptional regulator with XRE-family HTH domain
MEDPSLTEAAPPEHDSLLRKRLATNVRALRTRASLTLKQAAERAELHWRHWQKIEAAETNATMLTLSRLADALNVDPADLLSAEIPTKKR